MSPVVLLVLVTKKLRLLSLVGAVVLLPLLPQPVMQIAESASAIGSDFIAASWLAAHEARRIVAVAGPGVHRDLRERTQRPCPIDDAAGRMRRENPVGRPPMLDPLFERCEHVEGIR